MKNVKKLSVIFSLLTLSLSATALHASPTFHDIDEDYIVRVTVSEDVADKLSVTHIQGGEEVTRQVEHGETLSISLVDNMADPLILPFSAIKSGDQFILNLGDSDPMNSLNPILGYHSDLSTFGADKESAVTITAPEGKMQVVYSPGKLEEIAEPNDDFPMDIGEVFKVFSMDGVLDIQFIVKPVQATDDENAGEAGGQEDDGLNEDLGENAAAGGCSMVAATGSTGSLGAMSLLTLVGLFGLRRRVK